MKTNKKYLYFLILCFFFLSLQSIFSNDNDVVKPESINRAAAIRALDKASYFIGEENWSQALFEASLGSSYDSRFADFFYIEALALKALEKPRMEVIAKLEKSLSKGLEWRIYSHFDALTLCSLLYTKTLRYEDALSLINQCEQINADLDYIKTKSYFGLGEIKKANKLVLESLDRWPFDHRFSMIYLQQVKKLDLQSQKIVDTILGRIYLWEETYPEFLLLAERFESNKEKRIKNLEVFFSIINRKKEDFVTPLVNQHSIVLGLKYGLISDKKAINDFFNYSEKGLDIDYLFELDSYIVDDVSRSLFENQLKTFSGLIVEDSNNDNIIDTRTLYNYGRPETVFFDTYQDGVGVYLIDCELGMPKKITDFVNKKEIEYEVYPTVKTVFDKSLNREYTIKPQSLKWEPVKWHLMAFNFPNLSFFTIKLTNKEPKLSENLLVNSSTYFSMQDEENKNSKVKFYLENGMVISEEAKDDNGVYRQTSYLSGKPHISKLDRDGDGYFETTVYYNYNDSIKTVFIDINKNKTPEYKEVWNKDGSILYQWDSNEDGLWELSWQDGPGKLGIASWIHPETKLDVKVETYNKLPRTVYYNNESIPVLKDPESNVWWVKRIPSNSQEYSRLIENYFNLLGSNAVSGVIETKTGRTFVVRTGGFIFAELFIE